jgi:PmbA protein
MSGTSAKSISSGISPIADQVGQQLLDSKITIADDPVDDSMPGARPFDDEGVACRRLPLFENGVLRNFYTDLEYADKTGMQRTGHGYRTEPLFGTADPISLKPIPALRHFRIEPGESSLSDLMKLMGTGLVVDYTQGGHSGNIPNGDYSVGIASGFYVENGEVVGRVKDAMISGNAYEAFKNVIAIGDTLHPCGGGWVPAILFDRVSVSTKS